MPERGRCRRVIRPIITGLECVIRLRKEGKLAMPDWGGAGGRRSNDNDNDGEHGELAAHDH